MNVVVFGSLKRCAPCRQLHRVLGRYLEANPTAKGLIEFTDVDEGLNLVYAEHHNVMAIPTTIVFMDGEEVKRHVGAMSDEQFALFMGELTA